MTKVKEVAVLASNQELLDQVERRLEKRAAAEKQRLSAYLREPVGKLPTKEAAAAEKWKVEVLYMLGLSVSDIAKYLYGTRVGPNGEEIIERRGAVNKIVTTGNLVERRRANPVARLIALDRAPPRGMDGMVASYAARFNKQMLDAFEHVRGIVPLRQIEEQKTRAIARLVNVNSSSLNAAARGGEIAEWNLLAGFRLQMQQRQMPGGNMGGIDYSAIRVDGGTGDHDQRAIRHVAAAQAMTAARNAVLSAFHIQMTGASRWAIIDHVALRDLPIEAFQFPPRMPPEYGASPVRFLNDALEPLAHHFETVPAGVHLRKPTREEWARYDQAMAAEHGRRLRLFGA